MKDGQRTGTLIPRLNQSKDAQNWLSMQPNPLRYSDEDGRGFGEVNENNNLHGRVIITWKKGSVRIGYFVNGDYATGHYIYIWNDSIWFQVGEEYIEEGHKRNRGTYYERDGAEK